MRCALNQREVLADTAAHTAALIAAHTAAGADSAVEPL